MMSKLRPPAEIMAPLIQALATVLAAWIVTGGVESLSDALSPEESAEDIQVEVSRGFDSGLVAVAHNSGTGSGVLMPDGTIVATNASGEDSHHQAVFATSAGITGSQDRYVLGPGEASVLQITVELPNGVESCVLEFRTVRTVDLPRRSSPFECRGS